MYYFHNFLFMEQARPCEQVPLTTDERDMLLSVYQTRLRFMFLVYIIFFSKVLLLSFTGIMFADGPFLPWLMTAMIRSSFIDVILIISALYFLFVRILPFRYDARCGMKEKVSYTVVGKEYFPLTNQYYFALDHTEYLHHEVDEDTYNKCSEGDTIYLYRGIRSKYVFELNGRFSIV